MSTTNGGPRRASRRSNRRSLLGRYPEPELDLVGAPFSASPRSPSRWMPASPPLQYGIDYSFAQWLAGQPVRWRHSFPIIVRPTGGDSNAARAVAAVTTELACITGIDLRAGAPLPGPLDPRSIPDQEIHVAFAGDLNGVGTPVLGLRPEQAGTGGARTSSDPRRYVSGFAVINYAACGADPASDQAVAVLRHEMGHALGMGHASRRSQIMHHAFTSDATEYGRGDRHGLEVVCRASPRDRCLSVPDMTRTEICLT